mmetsp:Transcript_15245/g.42194  ORF Transcript_15245/g.42194 Transcript_15245/m.42194 type:complete len:138 (+) Transcript_15245:320-733(+)
MFGLFVLLYSFMGYTPSWNGKKDKVSGAIGLSRATTEVPVVVVTRATVIIPILGEEGLGRSLWYTEVPGSVRPPAKKMADLAPPFAPATGPVITCRRTLRTCFDGDGRQAKFWFIVILGGDRAIPFEHILCGWFIKG